MNFPTTFTWLAFEGLKVSTQFFRRQGLGPLFLRRSGSRSRFVLPPVGRRDGAQLGQQCVPRSSFENPPQFAFDSNFFKDCLRLVQLESVADCQNRRERKTKHRFSFFKKTVADLSCFRELLDQNKVREQCDSWTQRTGSFEGVLERSLCPAAVIGDTGKALQSHTITSHTSSHASMLWVLEDFKFQDLDISGKMSMSVSPSQEITSPAAHGTCAVAGSLCWRASEIKHFLCQGGEKNRMSKGVQVEMNIRRR